MKTDAQPLRYRSIIAAGVLFTFLWLSLLQHRAEAVEQLAAGVSSSIRHYFKHREGIEATQGHSSPSMLTRPPA